MAGWFPQTSKDRIKRLTDALAQVAPLSRRAEPIPAPPPPEPTGILRTHCDCLIRFYNSDNFKIVVGNVLFAWVVLFYFFKNFCNLGIL